ncbi:MAG: hypothetical protein ACKVQW_01590 [Pyrinomonadaceae bacterium]
MKTLNFCSFTLRLVLISMLGVICACSPTETKVVANSSASGSSTSNSTTSKGATIEIDAGGPADTVRAFYAKLREKKFKEALFLTNLRPAIEGLTDTELQDFSLDFEALAGQVPAELEINGEIISGENATVTVNIPNAETGKREAQPIKLRREGDAWVMLTVDAEGEKRIKAEGKQYFYNLRIEAHHEEAQAMLRRIAKAQLVFSAQNNGSFGDLQALVGANLLPDDITSSESTGYNYEIKLASDKKSYFANATPAEYGKSGKLSFLLDKLDIKSKDNGGKPLKK